MPRFYHHGMNGNGSGSGADSTRPADQGGGSLNGDGAELDSEDKRARNTQACEFHVPVQRNLKVNSRQRLDSEPNEKHI